MKTVCARTIILLALMAPALLAEEPALQVHPAAADAEAVRQLFQTAENFRVAQGATVPISVVHAASFESLDSPNALASNTFATIFGQTNGAGRLLPDLPINDWSNDFVNDIVAPTSLDGVRVLVNGVASPISFIGRAEKLNTPSDQINFLAPDIDAMGPVTVEVFHGEQMVAASTVNFGPLSPALFTFGSANGQTFPAVVAANGDFIAPAGFFGKALTTRPAASGETILLFGSGFGATEPPVPTGQVVTVLSQMPIGEIMVTIGGMPATVAFAGLAPNLAGLYQFNLTVPTLDNGIHPVVISRNGIAIQEGIFLAVENP